jgi:hypothetical protein
VTVGEWLVARTPRPPRALAARLDVVLGGALAHDRSEACELLIVAAETLATELLANGSTTRDSALDLLTADALVTYAFEAAAEQPDDLVSRAHDAMRRMAALGILPSPAHER